ncbi:MAG: hypothetical protein VW907_02360, partial [Opitutae bacterium]
MQIFLFFILSLFLGSCSVPDLAEPSTFSEAEQNAIELGTLQRKFKYGMFYLYVDSDDSPFSGWVKTTNPNYQLTELGYLLDGRKEGLWIAWDENGTKQSEIYWTEDRMEGSFTVWHPNGQIRVMGQTRDGEVDGEWTEYYSNGQLSYRSTNHIGHLVGISVWKPDGSVCQKSTVTE